MHRREVEPEADGGDESKPDACGDLPLSALLVLLRGKDDADQRRNNPEVLDGEGRSPWAIPKITGTIAEAPAIGATTAMAPTAIPR